MRISDWSSDVCSSDLPPRVQALQVVRLVARADPYARVPALRGRRRQRRLRHHQRRQPATRRERRADARAHVRAHTLRYPVQALVELLAERSEEHTSELQSLMRISYAVFCLKKKKTTQD